MGRNPQSTNRPEQASLILHLLEELVSQGPRTGTLVVGPIPHNFRSASALPIVRSLSINADGREPWSAKPRVLHRLAPGAPATPSAVTNRARFMIRSPKIPSSQHSRNPLGPPIREQWDNREATQPSDLCTPAPFLLKHERKNHTVFHALDAPSPGFTILKIQSPSGFVRRYPVQASLARSVVEQPKNITLTTAGAMDPGERNMAFRSQHPIFFTGKRGVCGLCAHWG